MQGFPQMMSAEDYVVKNHLAQVTSQSFASAEEAFKSTKSLLNLRGGVRARVHERRHRARVVG